jgi:hypothetical protein
VYFGPCLCVFLAVDFSVKVGDLVDNKTQTWPNPRLVVELHETAKSLVGILFEEEIKYVHYKHLEVVSESR